MLYYTYYKIIYKLLFIYYKIITTFKYLKQKKWPKKGYPKCPISGTGFFQKFSKKSQKKSKKRPH